MNIQIVRNTDQTLTFTKTGDYSGDTVKFTVKADKTLTSARIIDETASVSYSSPTSTITVALTPSDSASLSNDTYYYDLRVENDSTDRESLESGIVYVDKSVRNDTDGASVTSTSNVTTLTGSDFDANDTLVSDGTDFIGKSVSEMKTLLGLPSGILVGKVSSINIEGVGIITSAITKQVDSFSASETAEFAWAKSGTGYYRFTIPDAYDLLDGNSVINAFTVAIPSGFTITFTYSNNYIQVNLYSGGELTDLSVGETFTITFEFKTYE